MVQEGSSRKAYPSDLTNEQWAIVEPMIPPAKQHFRGGRPREVDMREVLNTIFYLNRSGCQWDITLTSSKLVGSKAFGGLNRRLKEKKAESRWLETTGQAPFGRAKAAYWKLNDHQLKA